jgi:hypothetical protein
MIVDNAEQQGYAPTALYFGHMHCWDLPNRHFPDGLVARLLPSRAQMSGQRGPVDI